MKTSTCSRCNKAFSLETQKALHEAQCASQYTCRICGKRTERRSNHDRHVAKCAENNNKESKDRRSGKDDDRHVQKRKSDEPTTDRKRLKSKESDDRSQSECGRCGERCETVWDLKCHAARCQQDYQCKGCGKKTDRATNHRRHAKTCVGLQGGGLPTENLPLRERREDSEVVTREPSLPTESDVSALPASIVAPTTTSNAVAGPNIHPTSPDTLTDVKQQPYDRNEDDSSDLPESDDNEELRQVVTAHWGSIKTSYKCQKVQDIVNVRLWDPVDNDYEADVWEKLLAVWKLGRWKIKLNASVGCILKHKTSGVYRYFHSCSNNATLFEQPVLVGSETALEGFADRVLSMDLEHESVSRRPNTEWQLFALTNVTFYFNKLMGLSRVGTPVELPPHVVRNRQVLGMVNNPRTGAPYRDKLCFFRCLAVKLACRCKEGACVCKVVPERRAISLARTFADDIGVDDEFGIDGVDELDLLRLEHLFNISITVFHSREDRTSDVVWCSKVSRPDAVPLNLNLHDDHFSYIRNLDSYSNSFACPACERCFNKGSNWRRHVCPVDKGSKLTFGGGAMKPPGNIFDTLQSKAGVCVPEELRHYPYRITYDIESLLPRDKLPVNNDTTTYENRHEFLSVSLCSNVPGYTEPECFVRKDTAEECVSRFVERLLEIADAANLLMERKFNDVFLSLRSVIDARESKETKYEKSGISNPRSYSKRYRLSGIEDELRAHLRAVPVVGFNSQKYDLNVIKGALVKSLAKAGESVDFAVKKMESMCCVQTDRLRFLDVCNFIAPGFTYSKYLQAYGVTENKGHFPYEWMDSLDKLDYADLPPQTAFDSRLRRDGISDDDYNNLRTVWREKGMKSVRDLLVWYNNLDVMPFVEALNRQTDIYRQRGIDMLKEAISLPGLAVIWMFKDLETPLSLKESYRRDKTNRDEWRRLRGAVVETLQVQLLDDDNDDLYKLLKSNLVGGPSLVFHRMHQAGITFIREHVYGDDAKLCQSILGVDANALYLYCLMQKMPVGRPRRRHADKGFRLEKRAGKTAAGWLAWREFTDDSGRLEVGEHDHERRLGRHNLPVDGYNPSTGTVYQFHGCYWHGHGCQLSNQRPVGKKSAEQRHAETIKKEEYLRHLGYRVVTVWECEWREQVGRDGRKKRFLKAYFEKTFGKPDGMTESQVLTKIKDGSLYGFVECDIRVPDDLLEYFSEMPPIFKNVEMGREHLSDHMREFAESNNHLKRPQRSLVGSMFGDKILLHTDLLAWYLDHGMVVTKIYQIVEYESRDLFRVSGDSVTEARRAGDSDPDMQLLANTFKLVGNSFYGKTITDKTRHRRVAYTDDVNSASLAVRSSYFQSINELDEGVFETLSFKKTLNMNTPVTVGLTILQLAKLRMLQYHYDCLDRYVDRHDYQLMNMDTDSSYVALSAVDIFDVVKPSLKREFLERYGEWYVTPYCEQHRDRFIEVKLAAEDWKMEPCCSAAKQRDSRTPGKFKEEFRGSEMVALNSKTYCVSKSQTELERMFPAKPNESEEQRQKRIGDQDRTRQKHSSKGLAKRTNRLDLDHYKSVLKTGSAVHGINTGFVKKKNKLYTYSQRKRGLTYFYGKRRVLADGVTTLYPYI